MDLLFPFSSYCVNEDFQRDVDYEWLKGHPRLVPDHSRKALSFSPVSMMLAVGFSN